MNTTLTEEQLVHIKKSLENSLTLVKRGLKHFASSSPSVSVTPQIKESFAQDPESAYCKYPQWLYHFQIIDTIIEIHRTRSFGYTVHTEHFIPKHDSIFNHPIFIFDQFYSSYAEASKCPPSHLQAIARSCDYGSFDKIDDAEKLFTSFLYQFLCYDNEDLELPF